MRVARIVTVIEGCIAVAQTASGGQLDGRVIRHATAPASSVLPLPIAVIEPAFLAGIMFATRAAPGVLERALCARFRAIAANAAAHDAGQEVTTAPPTR